MAAVLNSHAFKLTVQFRKADENPRDPRCKLAFRRICGTCAHYQGLLKPAGLGHDAAAIDTATCGQFAIQKHRLASARDCRRWERKAAANV